MGTVAERIRISAAGLLATYWCNARCAHCYEFSGPDRGGWMDVAAARRHFASLKQLGVAAKGIHIGGGEPFGDWDRLLAIVRSAREAGFDGMGYVETNGFWATSDAIVRERLRALRDAGMRQISISADVFHQAFVDPAAPVRLWHVALDVLGEAGVRARRWEYLKNPVDLRGLDDNDRRDAYREALARYPERLTGRAVRELTDLVPRRQADVFRDETCEGALIAKAHVHIDAWGNVFAGTCVGLLLGRTDGRRDLAAALAADRGPVWRALVAGGPVRLRDEVARPLGWRDDPAGYADKCHLCAQLRGFLLKCGGFESEIGPRDVYEEAD